MPDNGKTVLKATACFDHLGGTLGCRLFHRLVELGWFEPDFSNPRQYAITETGERSLAALGVDIYRQTIRRKR